MTAPPAIASPAAVTPAATPGSQRVGRLVDALGEAEARLLLEAASRRVGLWPFGGAARGPLVVELVALPVVVCERLASRPRVGRRLDLYVVERVLGGVWAISFELAAEDGEVVAEDGEVAAENGAAAHPAAVELPARLGLEQCGRALDAFATRAAFTFGRGRSRDAALLGPLDEDAYPFWLGYRRHRRGGIDFAAIDAVTGRRAGGAVRSAIAAALIDADRSLTTDR